MFGVGEFRSRKDLGNYPDLKSEDISSTNEETGPFREVKRLDHIDSAS